MIQIGNFDNFGGFAASHHEGKRILIHYNAEQIRILDFSTLKDISKTSFKLPIAHALIPRLNSQLTLRLVVITEDQFAHLLVLKQNTLKVSASVDLNQAVVFNFTLLLDNKMRSYVLCDNGSVALLSSKGSKKFTVSWPPKSMTRIHQIRFCDSLPGQHMVTPNSAAFYAYHYASDTCQITSWIMNFDKNTILNGPFSIQVSPNSIFISNRFFLQGNEIYVLEKQRQIGILQDISCCSSFWSDTIISDSLGHLYSITDKGIQPLDSLPCPPIRIEGDAEKCVYLQTNGVLTSSKSIQLPYNVSLSVSNSIFVRGQYPTVVPFPCIKSPEFPPCAVTIEEQLISSKTKGKWTPPHKIVTYNTKRIGNYDFIVAGTSATVHILKSHLKNPSVLPIQEHNWESPIQSVAINSKLIAVASIDNKITVRQYTGDEYSFTFESGLCTAMSLSEKTIATGFSDGSIIISSLADKNSIFSARLFRVPVKKMVHIDEDQVYVEWGSCGAVLTPKSIQWVKLPMFPGSLATYFLKQGILTLVFPNSVDIYSIADEQVLARIPQRAQAVCSYGRRIYILTIFNEVVIMHCHSSMKMETQFKVDVDNPKDIAIGGDFIYIVCQQWIMIYDKEGTKVDSIPLATPHKYVEPTPHGLIVFFSKSIWYITNKKQITKFAHETPGVCGISAIDDNRLCIGTAHHVILCDLSSGNKASLSTLAKTEKRICGIKAFNWQDEKTLDNVLALFDDDTTAKWSIPPPKNSNNNPTT